MPLRSKADTSTEERGRGQLLSNSNMCRYINLRNEHLTSLSARLTSRDLGLALDEADVGVGLVDCLPENYG